MRCFYDVKLLVHDVKLLVLGEKQSGKSSLISSFAEELSEDSSIDYQNVSPKKKRIIVNGIDINALVWERSSGNSLSIRGASGIIIAVDLSNPDSLKSLPKLLNFVNQNARDDAKVAIVGTKRDADGSMAPGCFDPFLKNTDGYPTIIGYFETSAKEVLKVKAAFKGLISEVISKDILITRAMTKYNSLIEKLDVFITKMESLSQSTKGIYDAGFLMFSPNKSKGMALKVDHLLAIKLREELNRREKSIETIFSDENIRLLRSNVIECNLMPQKEGFIEKLNIGKELRMILKLSQAEEQVSTASVGP